MSQWYWCHACKGYREEADDTVVPRKCVLCGEDEAVPSGPPAASPGETADVGMFEGLGWDSVREAAASKEELQERLRAVEGERDEALALLRWWIVAKKEHDGTTCTGGGCRNCETRKFLKRTERGGQ